MLNQGLAWPARGLVVHHLRPDLPVCVHWRGYGALPSSFLILHPGADFTSGAGWMGA